MADAALTEEGTVSPLLVSLLADMIEAALERGAKETPGVASTQERPAPSKEGVT